MGMIPDSARLRLLPLATLTLLCAASGCAPLPGSSHNAGIRSASSWSTEQTFARATATAANASAASWPDGEWWKSYGDPQLDALIEDGFHNAPDLQTAVARLQQAQAYRLEARAPLFPTADVGADAGLEKQSYYMGFPVEFVPKGWNSRGRFSADFGFDLDFWGRNRAALRAATSDVEAAHMEMAEARLMLSANIASAYADLARLFAERDVQEAALKVRIETEQLVAQRVATGLDTRAELKQAQSAVPAARSAIAATDEDIALTRNRLAALVGAGPDRGLSIGRPRAIAVSQGIPAGLTTDLLGRRPDVAAARARVEAAASRVKVARANFYPAFSLSAMVGMQSLYLENIVKSGATFGSVGPAMSLPIFHGGQLTGQYRGAEATYAEAVASYDQTVTEALHAVADAVTSRKMLDTRLDQSEQALRAAEDAYELARIRYQGGLSTFLDVLTAQDRMLENRRTVADLQSRAFTLDIALIRALGGGWSATAQTSRNSLDG